ncbi:MAG: HAMP domain-containing histidine kinase [Microcoleus sp. PH2017_10_PVI_O_A]|uniref:sensor histidine kinase n=1 Tax=unclassified Microcoleus TaxID=2642155 RepID=UPI001DFE708C|nr:MULTISPECIES: HAMP domain-containing sensor histidine kinase [unclassified Microcoleus]MCC3408607.1 HAMP domain-containing histidine kinase [Microcoleus sp. PH2017_10_PVI_O_A]MCC3462693.1 HAMP domain-containing histidine kinase [Microcoleus sp. PH2017_11_PCY_U_A]MCC3481145.1 HAMP domain-containing histidine kinase [Microcoleus sp. PH2017_12_PCY_D_A]MCC3530848.1 HAMP domain-containing histidine kinase [Microcoleus sp. PH2017_21_RUC_O_A]MCC3543227.1 HAMP domain-containing histidine kinase [Mi
MAPIGWSDLIYLGMGLGLGLGSSLIWRGRQKSLQQPEPAPYVPPTPQENDLEKFDALGEQLKQTQLAYQMASEMSLFKAGFLARTSHELRSPLSSMIGTLQLILSDLCDDPAEEREFVEQAHGAALKLVKLIDEIISVAKTEHGTDKMDIEPIQLAKVFDEIDDLTYLQAANRSIRLEILPPDPGIYVLADLPRFRQVLVHLIDTAIAQMEEGSISVSAHSSPESGCVHIWVDDQRSVSAWSESWDLLKHDLELDATKSSDNSHVSSGMRLLMNQTLLSLMNGKLEVLAVPSESEESNFNRTQCSIPLAKL